jgi:hypothetical protein
MDVVIVGIDFGKNSCSIACLDASGRVVLRRRMRRSSLESFVASAAARAIWAGCLPLRDTRFA